MSSNIAYPAVRRNEDASCVYHGTSVPNPYDWLEDPDSVETKEFVRAQNELTQPYIKNGALREKYKERLTQLWDFPKYGCPFQKGGRYFYFHNSGLQNQSVLYTQQTLDSDAEVFLDPNAFCADGLQSINGMRFSEDGKYCTYGVSHKGSDWLTIKIMEVESKDHLKETLENVKFSCISWTHDNKGFFYNRYNKDSSKQDGTETQANQNQKLYYHKIGTQQSEDVLIMHFDDQPKWMAHAELSDDGRYVFLNISEGCDPVNRLYCSDLLQNQISEKMNFVKIVDEFKAAYEYVANTGSLVTFRTNLDAPRYRLININVEDYTQEKWTDLIGENDKDVLEWCGCINENVLVICYLHDVKNKLFLHRLDDGALIQEIQLDVGTITGFSGEKNLSEIFFSFTSFLCPGIIYRADVSQKDFKVEIFKEIKVKGFDSSLFETRQIFYESLDATKIPMFLVHKKDLELNSEHACYLYGYGGFNISITPSFSVARLVFIQQLGGVLAVANIRGGGEYGEKWHKDGSLSKKQNCFDDFASAAEYLIKEKYTRPERLTISGGSNGGLLVTACLNQRPDLFKCVVAHVSVTDMLNFHKYTIGYAWISDFGCSDNEEDFKYLIKYSPLQNIGTVEHQCPSLLLLTADHDDRVVPLHSYKFIAQLQHTVGSRPNQTNPLLIRIDTESGHGGGKPTSKTLEELSDVYSFIAQQVGAVWSD